MKNLLTNKKIMAGCLCLLALGTVRAQSWLPQLPNPNIDVRLLACKYDKALLDESRVITPTSSDWEIKQERTTTADGGEKFTYVFKAKRLLQDAGVAVAFDSYRWSSDNYVLIPASVYNANRQRIVYRDYCSRVDNTDYYHKDLPLTSTPIPQLSPEFGARSRLDVSVCNTATPALAYFDRKEMQGTILLTEQGIERDGEVRDHALIVEESADRSLATFVISAPGVREKKPEFVGFSKSPDRGLTFKPGDEVRISVTRYTFPTDGVTGLLQRFFQVRKAHTGYSHVRNLIPMSKTLELMIGCIDERYLIKKGYQYEYEYYYPENAEWISFGWIGGLINTYPMLALGDQEHFRKVRNTFDYAIPRAQAPETGFFYTYLGPDGTIFDRDNGRWPLEHVLTRQNADVLYWMVKQFMLLQKQGKEAEISPTWKDNIRRLADAFTNVWEKEHTWGNYLDIKKGQVIVYNTTSGAMAAGGLALASVFYNEPHYMAVAKEAAGYYYNQFALLGFTSGGCGDILQNADSETAVALMTSCMALYEYGGEPVWLQRSKDLANLCATWTVSFDYQLPAYTELAKLGANLTGAVWASTQNKHGAPGFCTSSGDPIFKIYRATGDTLYADLMRDIIHGHAEGIQSSGHITERLTYCDADSRGSRLEGGRGNGWNETCGALMCMEIPGIYLRTDVDRCYVFDHVELKDIKRTSSGVTLTLHNPTRYDAMVSLLAESEDEASKPLGVNGFLHWRKVEIKAGRTVNYTVKKLK